MDHSKYPQVVVRLRYISATKIYAQKNITPAPAAIIFSLEGVFATIAAWILLSQVLNLNNILGCSFILIGVLFSQLMPEIKKVNYK